MNTLTTFNSTSNQSIAPPKGVEQTATKNAWYQGYEMGMAFCRLTEQLSSERGTKIEKELRCLEFALKQDFSKFCRHKSINLVDLGTGDGRKMILVIKALNEAGSCSVRYVPVDTNPYISRYAILSILGSGKKAWNKQEAELLFGPFGKLDCVAETTDSISIENLVRLSKPHATRTHFFVRKEVTVPMSGLEIDFFQHLPKVVSAVKALDGKRMNMFCMLGNTFGNYSPEKRESFLTTLYREMEAGELFLLGISLRPKGKPCCSAEMRFLEKEYLPGEAFMRWGADHPQSKYSSKYDPNSYCMIHSFERPDKSIQDVGYSYLFDAKEVMDDLDAAGLEVVACECYPNPIDSKTRSQIEYEPKYLTILVRKCE
jgi:hypothetical protein